MFKFVKHSLNGINTVLPLRLLYIEEVYSFSQIYGTIVDMDNKTLTVDIENDKNIYSVISDVVTEQCKLLNMKNISFSTKWPRLLVRVKEEVVYSFDLGDKVKFETMHVGSILNKSGGVIFLVSNEVYISDTLITENSIVTIFVENKENIISYEKLGLNFYRIFNVIYADTRMEMKFVYEEGSDTTWCYRHTFCGCSVFIRVYPREQNFEEFIKTIMEGLIDIFLLEIECHKLKYSEEFEIGHSVLIAVVLHDYLDTKVLRLCSLRQVITNKKVNIDRVYTGNSESISDILKIAGDRANIIDAHIILLGDVYLSQDYSYMTLEDLKLMDNL